MRYLESKVSKKISTVWQLEGSDITQVLEKWKKCNREGIVIPSPEAILGEAKYVIPRPKNSRKYQRSKEKNDEKDRVWIPVTYIDL